MQHQQSQYGWWHSSSNFHISIFYTVCDSGKTFEILCKSQYLQCLAHAEALMQFVSCLSGCLIQVSADGCWFLSGLRPVYFLPPCSQMCGAVWEGGLELQPAHSHLGITQSYNQHFLVKKITSCYGQIIRFLMSVLCSSSLNEKNYKEDAKSQLNFALPANCVPVKVLADLLLQMQWEGGDQIWYSVISDIYHSYMAAPLVLALRCF